jgi:hypothetical protein
MGMDISGINPIRRGDEPTIDWDNSTKEQQEQYWTLRDEYQTRNPGVYFRANLWSWRPIAELITTINETYGLGYDQNFIGKLHYNDGGGLKTQEECDKLANFLESYIENNFNGWERIGVYYGQLTYNTVNDEGHLVEKWMDEKEALDMILHSHDIDALISATVLYVKDGEVEHDGVVYRTTHSTSVEHLKSFIDFLRECGGFEIW